MPPGDLPSPQDKDAVIGALLARVDALVARVEQLEAQNGVLVARVAQLEVQNAALAAENAKLREKLDLPKKTPDNSSTPPSKGEKPSEAESRKAKAKPHRGAHRPLHPKPTRSREFRAAQCPHCDGDVSGIEQI